jgi:acetyl-CoA carboxylase biotin carboxyl carrier protein
MSKKNLSKTTEKNQSLSLDLVRQYCAFMNEQGLSEIDIQWGNQSIKLKKASAAFSNSVAAPQVISAQPAQLPTPVPSPVSQPASSKKVHVVTSPFVGTFYKSPGPNQEAFVEEGKTVHSGDTLCIVEAMKLMNEIESDVKGRVIRSLIGDGTPVEFGEPLFEIEPL